jgi:hypothetical protein
LDFDHLFYPKCTACYEPYSPPFFHNYSGLI